MKTAVSLPDETYMMIEQARQTVGMSRSEFFRVAGVRFAETVRQDQTRAALDSYVRQTGDDGSDQEWNLRARQSLEAVDW